MDDYKNIMKCLNAIDVKNYLAIVDFCKSLEADIDAVNRPTDNIMHKITLDDYKQCLFDIIQSATACIEYPGNDKQQDLQNNINALFKRLKSHVSMIDILKEQGETEENLDKRMSASMLKF